jgi:hypothetical protein
MEPPRDQNQLEKTSHERHAISTHLVRCLVTKDKPCHHIQLKI